MYYLLTESFKIQEEKLVALVLKTIKADKIFMLGSSLAKRRTESVFCTSAPSCSHVAHYYLLVLADEGCCLQEMQDKIENTCRSFLPVTAIAMHTPQFNNWLNEGHPFACTVVSKAVKLHDGSNIPLVLPGIQTGEAVKKMADHYRDSIVKVNEFIAGAELYRLRVQHKMAAFMLHQATEHALHSILKKNTGLHINTHSIDKMIRYCSMFSYKLPDLFPRNNEKNEKLFSLLQKAYIDTRYKDDYTICSADLLTLLNRVKVLQEMMQEENEA